MASPDMSEGIIRDKPSIVDSPIFKALYSDSESLLQFSSTKRMIPSALIMSNKDFMQVIHSSERGLKVDWNHVESSFKKLGQEGDLRAQSPGFFEWFNQLLANHKDYVQSMARFLNYDLWFNMIKAYYSPTGDIQLKSMFPITGAADMETYLHESEIFMAPELVNKRHIEWHKLNKERVKSEAVLFSIKNTETAVKRFQQLTRLNNIFENSYTEAQTKVRLANAVARRHHNALRQHKRNIIRQANLRTQQHQHGREGLEVMDNAIETVLSLDGAKYTSRYIADELPNAMSHVSLSQYPDAMNQMSTFSDGVSSSHI